MKKTYFFYVLVALFSFGFSQTIVTVDRANIIGPTTTGNDPSISSTGFVRGAGVTLATTGANHTSDSWNETSQTNAITNNDYIEWATTASASNEIDITEIDIRLRRNANGPTSLRIFYSLDDFATAGIPVAPEVTLSTTVATDYNFPSLTINSGTAGKVTFRLYAWNAPTSGGWLRIPNKNGWSDYGITRPGLRLIGSITDTSSFESESTITVTSFNPIDNIEYIDYSVTSGLNTTNAIKVGEFAILDGGTDLTDSDIVGTILTDLEFNVSNGSNLAALAIFDGTTNVTETTVSSDTAVFSSISGLFAADNSSKTFSIYATFNTTVNDNEQFQLTVTSASADSFLGSSFEAFDAGGAQTPIAGDDNRIEVIADEILFDQQPTDVNQFETMMPFPTLITVDDNGNLDLDYSNSVTVLSSDGDLEPSFITYTVVNGVATCNTLVFTKRGVVAFLNVFAPSLVGAQSNTFIVKGPLLTIAHQDFDGAMPDWSYTTNVATFDNGWGLDGYFDVIDSSIASPLDNASFSNNIFGENDLNDEGDNGTSNFGTITFATIDITGLDDVTLTFDWDVHGYTNDTGLVQYRLIEDGVAQPYIILVDGAVSEGTEEGTVTENISASVNSIALEVSIKNRNDIAGFSGFDNFKLTSVFDGLIHIDNGSFVGWEPSAPTTATGAQDAYVYSGEYTIGTDVLINNFFIRNGATTNISSQRSLIANGSVYNSGTLQLNSTSTGYSSIISDNINGEVIYNRHVNQFAATGSTTGQNDLISAPVTDANQTFLALRTENTEIPSGTISGVPSFLFGPFSNASDSYINYTTSDDTSLIELGIGYRTASTAVEGSEFKFVGNATTGIVNVPISIGTGSIQNLIGNPYPSYITLSAFLSENNGAFNPSRSGVYGYIGNVLAGFRVWNQAYSDANPNAKMTPGQGFFVSSKSVSESINFTPAMRIKGTQDDFIAGRSANINLANLTLQVEKANALASTDIYFNDNASLSMDPGYDSEMFEANAPAFSIYSHLVQDNLGKNMAAQSVSYSDLENVTIPLGINIEQGVQGTVSISENFIPEGTIVTLEDNVNNTFTNLLDGDYVFTPSTTLTGTGRFYLHFTTQSTLSDSDTILNGLEIYAISKTITIKGLLESDTMFNLYDVQGRLVNTQELNSRNTQNTVDVSNLTAGIYVVQLQNNAGTRTQKVIIK